MSFCKDNDWEARRTQKANSLRDALGIARVSQLSCLAYVEKQATTCKSKVPVRNNSIIDSIVVQLVNHPCPTTFINGDGEATLQLEKLAEYLICGRSHKKEFQVDGKVYTTYKYIASQLEPRLLSWFLGMRNSPDLHKARPHVPPSTPNIRKEKRHSRTSIRKEGKQADVFLSEPHQRPKLSRELEMWDGHTARSIRHSKRLSNTSLRHGCSEVDEEEPGIHLAPMPHTPDINSPDSIFSSDESPVFSIASTTSTQFSVDDYSDESEFESVVQVGSPARDRASRLKGKKPGAATRHPKPDEEYRYESHLSESKDKSQCTFWDEIPDYEVRTGTQQAPSSVNDQGVVYFPKMTFYPPKPQRNPVGKIIDVMRSNTKKRKTGYNPNAPGYIYGFSDKSCPGYLKIGVTTLNKGNKLNPNPILGSDGEYSEETTDRLSKLSSEYGLDLDVEFQIPMFYSAVKMEKLVHLTLHLEKRIAKGWKIQHTKKEYREWFRISADEAVAVIKGWEPFSKLSPYWPTGALKDEYVSYVTEYSPNFKTMTSKEWLNGPWKQFIDEQSRRMFEKGKTFFERPGADLGPSPENLLQEQFRLLSLDNAAIHKEMRKTTKRVSDMEESIRALKLQT